MPVDGMLKCESKILVRSLFTTTGVKLFYSLNLERVFMVKVLGAALVLAAQTLGDSGFKLIA
jgi:hypothetical protein